MALDLGTAIGYVSLDLTAFNTGVDAVVSSLDSMQSTLAGESASWSDFFVNAGKTATNFGEQLTAGVTLPLVDFGKSAIDSFIDYETAFTGVKKTLDVGDRNEWEIVQLYEEISEAIQDMAERTASSASEIAGVAEIAGQLGISAEDIVKFTEVMVMLGDTTNLSAEDASGALARFINVTGTSTDDIDRLGSVIVDLGNNFATDENQIVRMATRLASAGTIAGLTEREILALATAMSSVGINAEAGGSSMSQTLAQIEKAVQMAIAGDEGAIKMLETLAEVSGMTAEGFSKTWLDNPMFALTSFIRGLGNLDEASESTVLILDELGMTGIRQSNMLKSLSLASGLMLDAVKTSNGAWEENTALMNEANMRYGTTESQINQLNQAWERTKREIAELLLPILWELMDALRDLMEWWKGLSDETKENIVHFLEFAAVVGPVLTVVGKLTTGLGLVLKVFEGIAGLGSFVVGFFQGLTGHVSGFFGAVEAGGGKLTAFQGIFSGLWNVLKTAFGMMKGAVTSIIGFIGKIGASFIQHIVPIMTKLGGVTAVIGGIAAAVSAFVDMWNNGFSMAQAAVMALGLALAAVGAMLLGVPAGIAAIVAAVVGLVASAALLIKEHWDEIKQWFMDGIAAIGEFFSGLWESLGEFFTSVGENIAGFFSATFSNIGTFFSLLFAETGAFFVNMGKAAVDFFKNIFDGTHGFIGNVIDAVLTFFGDILRNVGEWFGGLILNVGAFFGLLFQNIGEFFGNIFIKLGEFLAENFGAVGEFFGNMLIKFGEFTKDVIGGFGDFIWDILDRFGTFVIDVAYAVGDFFAGLFEKIFGWLQNIWSGVTGWFGGLLDWIGGIPTFFFDAGKRILTGLWDGLKSGWDAVAGWFSEKFGWIQSIINGIKDAWNWVVGKVSGSHANGLDYVPYDGYVAQLHKGERVLTKSEAKAYNKGEGGKSGGDTFNFYNTKPDPYEYARQMKRAKREAAFG